MNKYINYLMNKASLIMLIINMFVLSCLFHFLIELVAMDSKYLFTKFHWQTFKMMLPITLFMSIWGTLALYLTRNK